MKLQRSSTKRTQTRGNPEDRGGYPRGDAPEIRKSPAAAAVTPYVVPTPAETGGFPVMGPHPGGFAAGLLQEWAVLRIRYEQLKAEGHSMQVNYAASAVAAKEREWLREVLGPDLVDG
jgi:hypothetical protein